MNAKDETVERLIARLIDERDIARRVLDDARERCNELLEEKRRLEEEVRGLRAILEERIREKGRKKD